MQARSLKQRENVSQQFCLRQMLQAGTGSTLLGTLQVASSGSSVVAPLQTSAQALARASSVQVATSAKLRVPSGVMSTHF
jgi:hypothetical protein